MNIPMGIPMDAEVHRVASLARRQPVTDEMAAAASRALRLRDYDEEGNENLLFPKQVEALRELVEVGGLFAPMRVGSGKTLITLLAPTVLRSVRPLLVVRASEKQKTREEFAAYRHNWRVRLPELVSYKLLGHPKHEDKLDQIRPDLLILDEAHKARNFDDSGAVRRLVRYVGNNPHCRVAVLSGTLMSGKILDYQHLAVMALREHAPLPLTRSDAGRWAAALDNDTALAQRVPIGALQSLPGGFFAWFRGSRGVVPTPGSDYKGTVICRPWSPELPAILRETAKEVAMTGVRPDGEPLDDWGVPDCLSQIALGFYYVWDPLPPLWWVQPRRAWFGYVRDVLGLRLEQFDTFSQVRDAVVAKRPNAKTRALPDIEHGRRLYREWIAVADKFTPNTVPIWLDPSPLQWAAERARQHNAIVWVKQRAAGFALQHFGLPYYGGGGANPQTLTRPGPIAASIAAHGTGKNLQHLWRHNIVLSLMAKAEGWEQLIGRTARKGQKSPTVEFDINQTIPYHADVLSRTIRDAKKDSANSGFPYHLVNAKWE